MKKVSQEFLDIHEKIDQKVREKIAVEKEIDELKRQAVDLKLLPFKIGDEVFALIKLGRTHKKVRCVLEYSDGRAYLRPYTKEGELSKVRSTLISFSKYESDFNAKELLEEVK